VLIRDAPVQFLLEKNTAVRPAQTPLKADAATNAVGARIRNAPVQKPPKAASVTKIFV